MGRGGREETARFRNTGQKGNQVLNKESYREQVRGGGGEELHHTSHPRSSGCVGTRGPRRATPRSRSGGAAGRRYPSSKVRGTQVRG